MKKTILTLLVILGIALTTQAQTLGALGQIEINGSNFKKGLFFQQDVYKGWGLYADYKFYDKVWEANLDDPEIMLKRRMLDLGFSYKLNDKVKFIASATAINKYTYNEELFITWYEEVYVKAVEMKTRQTYQVGAIFNVKPFDVLVAYQFNKQVQNDIAIGIGIKIY